MNIVWVVAKLRPGCEDPDEAVGVWEVSLAQSMEPDIAAGAALDIFHGKVAIGCGDAGREDFPGAVRGVQFRSASILKVTSP